MDAATVMLASVWVGLWFLWRPPPRPPPVFRPRSDFKVAYLEAGLDEAALYRDPTVIAIPSMPGAGPLAAERAGEEFGPRYDGRPPAYLERKPAAPAWPRETTWCPPTAGAARGNNRYRPVWPARGVFSRDTGDAMRVNVSASANLTERGLQVPGLERAAEWSANPWQVVVHLDFEEQRTPARVYLETGCDEENVNASVLRMMFRAQLSEPGDPCSGRVRVWFGAL